MQVERKPFSMDGTQQNQEMSRILDMKAPYPKRYSLDCNCVVETKGLKAKGRFWPNGMSAIWLPPQL